MAVNHPKFPMVVNYNDRKLTIDYHYDAIVDTDMYRISDGYHLMVFNKMKTYDEPLDHVIDSICYAFDQQLRGLPDYRHLGPTNKELCHPTLKRMWEEFQMTKILIWGKEPKP